MINGAFLRAGLIDEVSLMVEPVIDGRAGAPCVFDGPSDAGPAPLGALELIEHRLLGGGILWGRYKTGKCPATDPGTNARTTLIARLNQRLSFARRGARRGYGRPIARRHAP